ncbi:hypothetical protein V6N12_047633 [Hibiscus sabdariffa]|uniref:Uncharacterized protein n=1 Tax=Hibiscus sabdariffa TaxID=183260 RepID=A0ABR2CTJ0_9ROSI
MSFNASRGGSCVSSLVGISSTFDDGSWCFDVLTAQDDKGDASNRDNRSCPGRNLGGDSDLGRSSCCVIGLSLSPIN